MSAMGAKYAWLTAKHGCGFLLWPTKTKLPSGSPYGYDVGAAGAVKVDIVGEFMRECRARGIAPGLYYSLKVRSCSSAQQQHTRCNLC
jgi:alpha-L-fucosidase